MKAPVLHLKNSRLKLCWDFKKIHDLSSGVPNNQSAIKALVFFKNDGESFCGPLKKSRLKL